ncbi:tetratricopeptide repeat protein [Shewanella sp. JM162201]|uniref:Tetratricopeptide repeat protein n=1 Tax=Shewanella jiangmenensis TaxID=2837387 RepID=A0ABS5V5R5_9GAMM|nr:tetratricopeptide repeat protein [Shewanella jiangmenensis]MBT1445313.1 tetratricopeptide repeat protein [Shewanella jiangmenensis]
MTSLTQKSLAQKSLALALSLSTLLSIGAHAASISDIDDAMNRMDVQALKTLTDSSDGYTKAYGAYRHAVASGVMGNKAEQSRSADLAAGLLEQSANDDVEAKVLLAAVHGLQISVNPTLGESLGRKIQQLIADAKQQAPDNPRLALIEAANAFYTPVAFGGGEQKALTALDQAISGFKQPCTEICWGEAEAYTWRGLIYQQQGLKDKAAAQWQQALKVDPNYGWATYMLAESKR